MAQFSFPHFCFLACSGLEFFSLLLILCKFMDACIQAGEFTMNVQVYLFGIFSLLLPDLMFVLLMFRCFRLETLGKDVTAVSFNIFCAGVGTVIGIVLLMTTMRVCDNPSHMFLVVAGGILIISVVIHLINGVYIAII